MVQFRWTYFEGSYEWQKADDAKARVSPPFSDRIPVADSDWVLTNGRPIGTSDERIYHPPANLFLRFSETPRTKEGIRKFADRYGLLGLQYGQGQASITIPTERASNGAIPELSGGAVTGFTGSGELLSAWTHQIRDMRIAVELWTMLREAENGSDHALKRHILWRGSDRVFYETPPDEGKDYRISAVIASAEFQPEILKRFSPGSVVGPARYYLQRLINESLEGVVSPQLLWSWSRRRGAEAAAAPRTLGLYFVPESLLAHMWLQLAEAVAAHKRFRRCKACGTWMLLATSDEGSRTSRLTCSNTCRMRLYQVRMTKAAQLFVKGKTVDQIARTLDAEPSRVRGWVSAQAKSKESGRSTGR